MSLGRLFVELHALRLPQLSVNWHRNCLGEGVFEKVMHLGRLGEAMCILGYRFSTSGVFLKESVEYTKCIYQTNCKVHCTNVNWLGGASSTEALR